MFVLYFVHTFILMREKEKIPDTYKKCEPGSKNNNLILAIAQEEIARPTTPLVVH